MSKSRVYYYKDREVGIRWPGHDVKSRTEAHKPPRFRLRLPTFVETNDPGKADVFFLRHRRCWLSEEQIRALPYLNGNEGRHVFFDLGSDSDPNCYRAFSDIPAIYFNACTTVDLLEKDPHMIAWPWPVEDFKDYMELPQGGFKYDVVFQGQAPNELNNTVLDSVEKHPYLRSYVLRLSQFWPYMEPGKAKTLRRSYLDSMQRGRFHLCPTSVPRGIVRYRLYEGMTMRKIGVLIGDGCVLPHERKINWNDCIIRIDEADAAYTGDILWEWLQKHSDKDIVEMGRIARLQYDLWLKREKWEDIFDIVVRERLGL